MQKTHNQTALSDNLGMRMCSLELSLILFWRWCTLWRTGTHLSSDKHPTNMAPFKNPIDTAHMKYKSLHFRISSLLIIWLNASLVHLKKKKKKRPDRLAENTHAICTGNINSLSTFSNNNPTTLQGFGIDQIHSSIQNGEMLRTLYQREALWIWQVTANHIQVLQPQHIVVCVNLW